MNKIPSTAKKVFKGVIFDVYQWQQKMFDGSYQTFEMLKRPDTVQIIPILENGKIIVLEEKQPGRKFYMSLVGGRVDPGESPLQATKREMLEETGLKSKKIIPLMKVKLTSKIDWNIYFFVARNCKKVQEPILDAGEKIIVQKITFNEFVKLGAIKGFKSGEFDRTLLRAEYDKKYRQEFKNLLYGE